MAEALNKAQEGDNTYVAVYDGKEHIVHAPTAHRAQINAASALKVPHKRTYRIAIKGR